MLDPDSSSSLLLNTCPWCPLHFSGQSFRQAARDQDGVLNACKSRGRGRRDRNGKEGRSHNGCMSHKGLRNTSSNHVMQTNNSSIVSKRSVERLYLPQPHFYRYFVRKPQRRSPTINRGYWLRMRAIDWVIRQFLEKPSDQRKVIINLGCG